MPRATALQIITEPHNPPSKWLAEEYIKVDSTFDLYLNNLEQLTKKKTGGLATFCYRLLQHYQSEMGKQQLELLNQMATLETTKALTKTSTHDGVF
ncbi:hypothetical protein BGZ54_010202 [Gamsiella multidivaricata]|nr:hypothetical protein BGZ54_010202 [Gamsiella multidivaricata]